MKSRFFRIVLALLILTPGARILAQKPAAPAAGSSTDQGWPRSIDRDGLNLVYYQPQVDDWKDRRVLNARMAFVVTPKGGKPTPGIATLSGNTKVDMASHSVFIDKLQIGTLKFPNLSAADAAPMEQLMRTLFPGKAMTISLDRLLASLKQATKVSKGVAVKMDVPAIFASSTPAILLSVPEKPVLGPVQDTNLQFVVNANWDVIFDPTVARFFLLTGKVWLSSDKLDGTWTRAGALPAAMKKLPAGAMWDEVRKGASAWNPTANVAVPRVFYSSAPAELIVFKGEPTYAPIKGTKLVWATNTDSQVFYDGTNKLFYFLVAGRWFRAANLAGAWTYAGKELPADFKAIPPSDPSASALASVPGTSDAEDAVLLAQIPTTAIVKRSEAEAKAKVVYNGPPVFQPIDGTNLAVAANTSSDVIQDGAKYYLCQDAVWFVGDSPEGPWKITTSVPKSIYDIPPSSSAYRLTYVQADDTTDPNTVEESYTSGYTGSYVSNDGGDDSLVWGTGWYYPPYIGWANGFPIYQPFWNTYGLDAGYLWGAGGFAVGGYAYGPYGTAGRAAWHNSATGFYSRGATASGPYGSRTVAEGYNPRTGTGYVSKQGSGPYASWGTTAATRGNQWVQAGHVTTANGTVVGWRGPDGTGGVKTVGTPNAPAVAPRAAAATAVNTDRGNNIYSGKDGNIYRHESDGSWQKYGDNGWEAANRAAADATTAAARAAQPQLQAEAARVAATRPPDDVEREYNARVQGSERAASYNRAGSGAERAAAARTRGGTDPAARAAVHGNVGGGRGGGGGRR